MKTIKSAAAMLAILVATVALVTTAFLLRSNIAHTSNGLGQLPSSVWQTEASSSRAQNELGSFNVEAALITPKDMLLFYSIQGRSTGTPSVLASRTVGGQSSSQSLTVNSIASLGSVGSVQVGVISLPCEDIPGQEISLDVMPAGASKQLWHVTPIRQVTSASPIKAQSREFFTFGSEASMLRLDLGRLAGDETGTLVKASLREQSGSAIYLRVDTKSLASTITQAQYDAAVGSATNALGGTITPGVATPAPPEPK